MAESKNMGWSILQEGARQVAERARQFGATLRQKGSDLRREVRIRGEQATIALHEGSEHALQTARERYAQFAEKAHRAREEGEERVVDFVNRVVGTQVDVLFGNYGLPASIGVPQSLEETFRHEIADSYLTHVAPGVLRDVSESLRAFGNTADTPRIPRARRLAPGGKTDTETATATIGEMFDQLKGPASHVLAALVEFGGPIAIRLVKELLTNVEKVEASELSTQDARKVAILRKLAEELGKKWALLRLQGVKDIGSIKAREAITPILEQYRTELVEKIVAANA